MGGISRNHRALALLSASLAWASLAPAQPVTLAEKPVKFQLYARAAAGGCTVSVKGTAAAGSDQVRLNLYAGKERAQTWVQPAPGPFAFSAPLTAGLIEYRFEIQARQNGAEQTAWSADSILCGDAYLIYGQSNAEALYGTGEYTYRSEWIRTYRGSWQKATSGDGASHIGVWGQHLGRLLADRQKVPVAILNPALGNMSIDELSPGHVPAPGSSPANEAGKYGNLYNRMKGWAEETGLAPRLKAMLWHQGEKQVYGNDYNTYYADFLSLRKAVYADLPGIKDIFLFQIKTGCGSGGIGWSIMFEDQRKLAADFPDIGIMSTLAPNLIGCHLGEDGLPGYQQAAESLYPLIDARFYGGRYAKPVTPPNLLQAAWANAAKDEVVLQFDQDMKWTDSLVYDASNPAHQDCGRPRPNFSRDLFGFDAGVLGQVVSGRADGSRIRLKLKTPSAFAKIAYPHGNLSGCWAGPYLQGAANDLGALGFYVPIDASLKPVGVQARREARRPVYARRFDGGRPDILGRLHR